MREQAEGSGEPITYITLSRRLALRFCSRYDLCLEDASLEQRYRSVNTPGQHHLLLYVDGAMGEAELRKPLERAE